MRPGAGLLVAVALLPACTASGPRPEATKPSPSVEGPSAPAGLIAYSADLDGGWDFYEGDADIFVMDPDEAGEQPVNLTHHPANDYSPEWSPDGTRIAFRTDRDGNHEIYVMNADGSGLRNLTQNPAEERSPSWSPDGERVIFASDRDGEYDLYVMDADDEDASSVRRLEVPGFDEYPTWSPDGSRIAFTNACASCAGFGLAITDAGGGDLLELGVAAGWPDWSPRGDAIAYDSGVLGEIPTIYVVRPEARAKPQAVGSGVQADWSPDASELVFSRPPEPPNGGDLQGDLFAMDADGSDVRRLTDTPEAFEFEPTFQPTGTSAFVSLDPEVMDRRYEEALSRFDYPPDASLGVREESEPLEQGEVVRVDISYESPLGGRVPATLVRPLEPGTYPGVLAMHGLPSSRSDVEFVARRIAAMGAVVLAIDAPFARPGGALDVGADPITFTPRDAHDQVQLMVDLKRGVDLLQADPDVDPERIGYLGYSYGGAMGGLLAGLEPRIRAFALVVGDGGILTHLTGIDDVGGPFWDLPERRRERWVAAMEAIEPLYFLRHAAPSRLLFHNGLQDEAVPPVDAVVYQAAGSEPKDVRWYDAGHGLTPEAECDHLLWLADQLAMTGEPQPPC